MKTRELARDQWPDFCRKLAADYKGSIISANQTAPGGAQQSLVEKAPLEDVQFSERTGECSDTLRIKAGGVDHEIVEPIRIKLRDGDGSGNARYTRVEILAENGATIISIKPGLPADF